MNLTYNDIKEYAEELHVVTKKIEENVSVIKNIGTSLETKEIWVSPSVNYYETKLNNLLLNFNEIIEELESSILYMAKVSDGYKAINEKLLQEICGRLKMLEPSLESSHIFGGL